MTEPVSRRRLLAGGVVTAAAALAGCVAAGSREVQEDETETFAVDDLESVSVGARNGQLTVRSEDRETIAVRRVTRAASEDDAENVWLESTQTGDRLDLAVEREDSPGLIRIGPSPRMDLEVTVPEGFEVERAAVRNGTVDVADVAGPLVVEARNGIVEIRDVDGDLTATARNGTVDVAGVAGSLTAETRNGPVELANVAGDVEVQTRNGEVSLEVPSTLDAVIGISTRNGEISVDGIDDLTATSGDSSFHGTAGEGSRRIALETRNGAVTVRGRE
ncbi:DUF4097 family beta strand repeat-containing protein [Natronobeatus ordinarius]|uniref:DUF4097 family beta strand repeat-containing protein n=1 Tax=Natronobeatus ordinarius TaxID=2963433 RepID=UPI0020CB7A10|nr:DUF4097 family beta strand repeat-containing protein [Natronobeatus ordinarius]